MDVVVAELEPYSEALRERRWNEPVTASRPFGVQKASGVAVPVAELIEDGLFPEPQHEPRGGSIDATGVVQRHTWFPPLIEFSEGLGRSKFYRVPPCSPKSQDARIVCR